MTALDGVALVWWLGLWLVYNLVLDRWQRGPSGINTYLRGIRRGWMRRMMERENRITDAALIGNVIQSASFFASTAILVLAGLVGLLGYADAARAVIADLAFAVKPTKAIVEIKLVALVAIFVYAFFKFTWALRQFNYITALIGAASEWPEDPAARRALNTPEEARAREAYAVNSAEVLTSAMTSFNGGTRAFYFALAVLAWFMHAWAFIVAASIVMVVLLRRQFGSRTFAAIRAIAKAEAGPDHTRPNG
jgi:uncharacterized membrane protein